MRCIPNYKSVGWVQNSDFLQCGLCRNPLWDRYIATAEPFSRFTAVNKRWSSLQADNIHKYWHNHYFYLLLMLNNQKFRLDFFYPVDIWSSRQQNIFKLIASKNCRQKRTLSAVAGHLRSRRISFIQWYIVLYQGRIVISAKISLQDLPIKIQFLTGKELFSYKF